MYLINKNRVPYDDIVIILKKRTITRVYYCANELVFSSNKLSTHPIWVIVGTRL